MSPWDSLNHEKGRDEPATRNFSERYLFTYRESAVPVLFFSTLHDHAVQGFKAIVQAEVWPDQLEICRSVKALSQRLHRPRGDLRIAVVSVSSQEELTEVVSLKDLLDDLATILIVPDIGTDNVARAHEIRPRFLACTDSNPIVIAAVLAKMLRRHENQLVPKGGKKNERRD
jgi:hypothetical protein